MNVSREEALMVTAFCLAGTKHFESNKAQFFNSRKYAFHSKKRRIREKHIKIMMRLLEPPKPIKRRRLNPKSKLEKKIQINYPRSV